MHIYNFILNIKAFDSLPPDLFSTDLMKKAIMTYGYAQGWESREIDFRDKIENYYIEKGFAKISIELDRILVLLTNYFRSFNKTDLQTVQNYLMITKNYAKEQDVIIPLKYLTWTMIKINKRAMRHRFYSPKPRRFTLYHTYGIDNKKMSITFPSIFVQGLDVHIFHEILNIVRVINEDLNEKGLPLICITGNHDCFSINARYAYLLITIVQQAYNSINNLEFSQIPGLKSKDSFIECCNPICIKH